MEGSFKCEVDTALIKLYAKDKPDKLITFLNGGGNCGGWPDLSADYDDCSSILIKMDRRHALGLLHWRMGRQYQSFHVWAELLNKAVADELFPGIEFFVSRLMHSSEELIWKYADTILKTNEILGVKLFLHELVKGTGTQDEVSKINDKILAFLKPQYPVAYMLFLEHLVLAQKLQVEKYHTQLALAYLDGFRRQLANTE